MAIVKNNYMQVLCRGIVIKCIERRGLLFRRQTATYHKITKEVDKIYGKRKK